MHDLHYFLLILPSESRKCEIYGLFKPMAFPRHKAKAATRRRPP